MEFKESEKIIYKISFFEKNKSFHFNSRERKNDAILEMENLFFSGIFNHVIVQNKNGDIIAEKERDIMYIS